MPQAGKVLLKRALVKLLSRSKNSSSQFSVQIQVAGARLASAFSDFSFLFRDGNFSEIVEIKMYSLRRGPLGISGNLWKKESLTSSILFLSMVARCFKASLNLA